MTFSPPVATCSRCGDELPLDGFARDASKASGRKSHCKGCDRAKSRRYYEANRDKVLARYVPAPLREALCDGCREPFMAKGRQCYCKPSCRPGGDRGATVEAVCDHCGEPFEARARDRARGWARFCGKGCALRTRRAAA
jgi:hypothetical protein